MYLVILCLLFPFVFLYVFDCNLFGFKSLAMSCLKLVLWWIQRRPSAPCCSLNSINKFCLVRFYFHYIYLFMLMWNYWSIFECAILITNYRCLFVFGKWWLSLKKRHMLPYRPHLLKVSLQPEPIVWYVESYIVGVGFRTHASTLACLCYVTYLTCDGHAACVTWGTTEFKTWIL